MKIWIKKYDGSEEEVTDVLSARYDAETGFLDITYVDASAKSMVGAKSFGSGHWRSISLGEEK